MKRLSAVLLPILFASMMLMLALSVSAEELPDALAGNGLPVVIITIDENADGYATIEEMNSSPDHTAKCTGTVKIIVPDGYTGDYSDIVLSGTEELTLEYIRGRGNTTWAAPKKPYKFKLDEKADLLGMGKNKHWVLLANYMDSTLLRNRLISYMGSQIGLAYTPKMLPVDVVMNGEYLGSYYLSEQVRVGGNRVDIDELTPEDNSEPEITGGYLIGMYVFGDEPEANLFTTERGAGFLFDTPEFESDDPADEVGTPEQKAYISDYLQKAEDAIYDGDPGEYMDLQSAADYWWIQTFSYNYDAFFTSSTYLYKPREDKLYWGPLWDFDLSMGRSFSKTDGYGIRENPWFDYLRENNESFRHLLIERWAVLDTIITDIVRDGGVLDGYTAEIKNSWEDNLAFAEDSYADFEWEMERLRLWLTERQEWINGNLDLIEKVNCTVTFLADGEIAEQKEIVTGMTVSELPQAPEKDGYVFIGWEYDSELINTYDPPAIWDDTVITARYLSEDEVTRADQIFFSGYDVWADMSWYNIYFTSYTVTPDDALDKQVTWSSSDSDMAEVGQNGYVTMKQCGEVTITGTLSSGYSRSFTLHIYDGSVTEPNEPEAITLEESSITIKAGEYAQIIASASPQPCDAYFNYYSDDDGIIEVFANGVIKGLAPGTTTVMVGLNDLETVCTVLVTDGEESTEEETDAPTEAPAAEPTEHPTEAASVSEPDTPAQTTAEAEPLPAGGGPLVPILLGIAAAVIVLILCLILFRKKKVK